MNGILDRKNGDKIRMNQNNADLQAKFLAKIQETVALAKENGSKIAENDLFAEFAEMDLSDEQMEQVRAYLRGSGVVIDSSAGSSVPLEERITEEEHNYLEEYTTLIESIELPSDSVLDAIKLSAMAGERSAQKELIEFSLGKVIQIARLYAGQGVFVEDLIGSGNEALTIGVTLLGPLEHPEEVDGFLGKRIMDAMEDLIAQTIDEHAVEKEVENKVNLVAEKARELSAELGRKVTPGELAAEGEVTLEDIEEARRLSGDKIEEIG